MTVWVLFVYVSASWPASAYSYPNRAECEEAKAMYRRAACVKVDVPKL